MRGMHDSKSESTIGQKAAQMGFTEWALNVAFYYLDIEKKDVLYVLPNAMPDASVFSSSRFDVAVELSEHLARMFAEVQNVTHKRSGAANMYIRGGNSRSQLKSVPVSLLILDEVDEMVEANIPLAFERMMGQLTRKMLMLSTPTIPDYGINSYFEDSTQEHFRFKCPSCSRRIELKWPDNVIICGENSSDPRYKDSYLICHECKATLHHEDKINFLNTGEWEAEFGNRDKRGFYVNQMYSMNLPVSEMVEKWHLAQKDIATEQEFWNSKMGLPHIPKGSKVDSAMIEACIANYKKIDFNRQGLITMGVDQGKTLHVEIDQWFLRGRSGYDINSYAQCKMLTHFEVNNFEDLDALMFDFGVNFCVIDGQPERRKALEFANRFPGLVRLCWYPVGVNGRNITPSKDDELTVKVDRTSWLDLSLGRFKNGTITLPMDTTLDYKQQIQAQVRIPKKDSNGNPVTRYETPGNRADHYGHARNYAEIALPFAAGMGQASNIM